MYWCGVGSAVAEFYCKVRHEAHGYCICTVHAADAAPKLLRGPIHPVMPGVNEIKFGLVN